MRASSSGGIGFSTFAARRNSGEGFMGAHSGSGTLGVCAAGGAGGVAAFRPQPSARDSVISAVNMMHAKLLDGILTAFSLIT